MLLIYFPTKRVFRILNILEIDETAAVIQLNLEFRSLVNFKIDLFC